jgi:hypothetical protein
MNFDVILRSISFGFSNVEHGNNCAFFSFCDVIKGSILNNHKAI